MPEPMGTHSDIRSEDQQFKRSRDHAKKYKYFPKPGNAPITYGGTFGIGPQIDENGNVITVFNGFGL